MNSTASHTAAPSALGYLYQCRVALLFALKTCKDAPEVRISVEKFDDVAFQSDGCPTDLIQTKHRLKSNPSLSDKSSDLWNTLGNWCKWSGTNIDVNPSVRFLLITTAGAPEGSAASYLRRGERDEKLADQLLLKAADESSNQANTDAYEVYRNLNRRNRHSLLSRIFIIDQSAHITDTRRAIEDELHYVTNHKNLKHFVDRLEGWWFDIVIKALSGHSDDSISVLAIESKIEQLRQAFVRDSLPVDFGSVTPPPDVIAELDERPFVRQLRKINIGPDRRGYAIRDYYRAYEQRGRWLREELILDGELDKYDQQLVEAWEPRFAAMQEDSEQMSSADGRIELGKSLFRWAEQDALFTFRGVSEHFLTHGSFEILSNRIRIGWHPDYKEHIRSFNAEED